MKKIIRTNNLQKALEDYDALKGQAVSYVSVLPLPPNVRNCVYCKQSTTNIEESMVLTVDRLIENYAQETETASHFVIPETYTITYSNDVVKGIEVSDDVAIMYEDEDFTTALATTFNLEDNYIFDVITHVTEMAYYMGDAVNQILHPVVSFGVIAEVHSKIDRVERELDAKIDSNYNTLDNKIDNSYNTLDNKIDNSYNTLDNKIDNEISNLAVNFTTNNLVANVATVNNATVTNASVSSLNVAEIIANGSAGTNGQILGKVNGNLEWQDFSTDNFVVNNITVNKNAVADNASVNNLAVANIIANNATVNNATVNNASVNGNNFTHKGFDVTSMTLISEDDYNNLDWSFRNSALYMTTPNGNMYFHGIQYAATYIPEKPKAGAITVDLPNMANNNLTLETSTLTFTSGTVTNNFVNGGAYNGSLCVTPIGTSLHNNTAPITTGYGTQANDGNIITNANELYIIDASFMYKKCRRLTDTFISNPSLITGAPAGYDPMKYCTNMSYMFSDCVRFNQPINIPNSVTDISGIFCSLLLYEPWFNQPINIPSSVTNMNDAFSGCLRFNQPINIPSNVTNMSNVFNYCCSFNQPINIPSSVTNMNNVFNSCISFNQPINIPSSVTDLTNTFLNCNTLANSTVPIHISHTIAKGNTSNYIYNMLVNGGCGITFAASRILNDL